MNMKELNSKKLYKEYLIDIPYAEVDKLINKKIDEITPTVNLPGFRKGKAPINIIKRKYENTIVGEILENIVQEKIKILLKKTKIKPFRIPKS